MSYLHTHTIYTLKSDLFWVVKSCGLRGESRRDYEEVLRYGVKINHMITLGSREFIFLTYIIFVFNLIRILIVHPNPQIS